MEYQNTALIAFALVLLTLWYMNRRKRYQVFKNAGIPGPEPHIILGNLREINEKTLPEALKSWRQKYGKTFGYYLGGVPFLVTMDTEVLKQVQIKDFHSFINRPRLVVGGEKKFHQHIIAQEDDKWKQQRAILTPTFTSGKMKQMISHMDTAVNILLGKIEEKSIENEGFDIYDMFKGLTLDVISRTAFGTETKVQSNPNDPFLLGVKELLREGPIGGIALISKMVRWRRADPKVEIGDISWLLALMTNIQICHFKFVKQNRREDLLQLMLDAEMSSDMASVSADNLTAGYESESKMGHSKGETKQKTSYGLSENEVVSNTVVFVFAGYETTSTALAYTSHILVNFPDIQEKVRKEILDVQAENDGKLDYIALSKLKYLDMVFSETLRYYPPVTGFISRTAKKDVQYGNTKISEGTVVLIPVELLHRDPEYWSEPDKFIPERFAPENRSKINQMAYQPFGQGPRNCIGMRFAQMEAKLALAKILSQYRLVPFAKTELGDIEISFKAIISTPKNGVHIKAEKL